MMIFQLGDMVKWTSSSGGYSKTKQGEIVAIIPAGRHCYHVLGEVLLGGWRKRYNVSLIEYGILPRNHESYVIAVPAKTSKGRSKLYWPIVNKLKRVREE